jgi:DNA-binding transcriptional LysR family regulator
MSLNNLRKFMLVAECGSISRAATRLNIAQPTLSRTVKQLEHQHGVPLFERHGEGVTLTEFGKVLFSRSQEILNQYRRANDEIALLKGRNKVPLRIAAGDLWGYVHLPNIIRDYLDRNQDVFIELEIVSHSRRLDGLRNRTYDVVFGIVDKTVESFMSLEFRRMAEEGFCVFGDKEHPLAGQAYVNAEDLSAYRWINHKFEFGLYDGTGMPDTRNYSLKVNTLLNTLQTMRGTELLISASSGFTSLFEQFGLAIICADSTRPVLPSGAIFWGDLEDRPHLRSFVRMCESKISENAG